jgi:hypothetical protein
MNSPGRSISLSGVIVTLISFFLPWMTVSCGERVTTLSGVQLAVGGVVTSNAGPEERKADPFVLCAFIAAIIVLVVIVLLWRRSVLPLPGSLAISALGGLALLILAFKFATTQSDTSGDVDVIVQYHPGFFGAVLGYLLILIGGVMDLFGAMRSRAKPPPD